MWSEIGQSSLEFHLHLQSYVTLCSNRKSSEAIQYLKKHLTPIVLTEESEGEGPLGAVLRRAMGLLVFTKDTKCPHYKVNFCSVTAEEDEVDSSLATSPPLSTDFLLTRSLHFPCDPIPRHFPATPRSSQCTTSALSSPSRSSLSQNWCLHIRRRQGRLLFDSGGWHKRERAARDFKD